MQFFRQTSQFTNLVAIVITFAAIITSLATSPIAKPGCDDRCGNVSVPFPFGTAAGCYFSDQFFVNCSTKLGAAYLRNSNIPVTNISLNGQMTVKQFIASDCYDRIGTLVGYARPSINFASFTVSTAANKFVVVGCDTTASVSGRRLDRRSYSTGCSATCGGADDVENGTCTGLGCCETSIPRNVRRVNISLSSNNNYTDVWDFNNCGYAFVVEESYFSFSLEKIKSLRKVEMLPMVVDWAIDNETCAKAMANSSAYACLSLNSECYDADNGFGYRCNCTQGYRGNPYLVGGCLDVDECKELGVSICSKEAYCENTAGSYKCLCSKGFHGNGTANGEDCIRSESNSKSESLVFRLAAGICLGIIVLLLSAFWIYIVLQRRRMIKMRQHYFHQNGGMLLQEKLHERERSPDMAKIYSEFELKKATNTFHSSMIIGQGGYGTVYKGFLPGTGVVAIKKAKEVPTQVDQFTNEVIVLSQIKHKNVVKLLGCCLETEVPLLVYEFINNGTLSDHVHDKARARTLSWETRLKIATDVARVLSYLHSDAASTPIIHRDVKCANILLDNGFTAKVSDFGASRLVPLDPMQLSTMVQGTFGYLDPEYMQTNQLNEKSDVYSFGVVLVELLTGMKALSYDRPEEERNLANLFVKKRDDLFQILEDNVVREGSKEEVMEVAILAERCLKVRGEERPSMKEVAMELEGVMRVGGKHSWIRRDDRVEEDTESLLGKGFVGLSSSGENSSSVGFDSLRDHVILPVDGGR